MQAAPRPMEYLPIDLVEASRRQLSANHLWVFFSKQIGEAAANAIFEKYRVGTSKHWQGATAFWQIDNKGNARQCKVMLYKPDTGRRVKKDGGSFAIFMGKRILGNNDANLQQCLFGCHLLSQYPAAPVAIVESEKTAMYCAHIYPNLVWLATGGKQGCSLQSKAVLEPLKGRTIIMFPDLMATKDWQDKARIIGEMIPCKIHVSTDLEKMASDADKAAGLDLMDYLLQQDTTQQQTPPPAFSYPIKKEQPPAPGFSYTKKKEPPPVADGPAIGPNVSPASWDEPAAPVDMAAIVAKFGHSATFETSTSPETNKGSNSPKEAANEAFTLQWFINEAQKWFNRSMVKNPVDYYPAFIASYRPLLRKNGISESALMESLIL
jgi:hypothetical protein